MPVSELWGWWVAGSSGTGEYAVMSGAPVAWKAASRSPVGKGMTRQGPPGRVIVMVPEPSACGCWAINKAGLTRISPRMALLANR